MSTNSVFGEFGLVYRIMAGMASAYSRLPGKPCRRLLRDIYHIYEKWYHRSQVQERQRIVTTNVGGINYELDLSELIDSTIYHRGCFEPHTTANIAKYVKPGMVALDIGANIGWHTLGMAKLVGENGRVIAFEPTSWAFAKLQKNVSLNQFNNIVLEKIGLSDSGGVETVQFRSSWQLGGPTEYEGDKEVVKLERLDDYTIRAGLKRIDFIKLDVDGYESKVLRGALGTIGRSKPMIIVECSTKPDAVNTNVMDTINILVSLGYEFYSENKLKRYKTKEALFKSVLKNSSENIVAFPADGRCRLCK